MEKTICIFIHYDSNDLYSEEDINYIKELTKVFSDVIVLTSNTREVTSVESVKTIHNMSNVGFDFGKLETYLNSVEINAIDNLYVFNNSCLLVRDLSDSIELMKKKNYEFWGYTTSTELAMHVQSYFLYFNKNAISVLRNFLKKYSPTKNKYSHNDVVKKIELPLLTYMIENKINCGSYLNTHKLFPYVNSTIFHADKLLILNPHFPFIKKKVYTFAKIFTKEYLLSLA